MTIRGIRLARAAVVLGLAFALAPAALAGYTVHSPHVTAGKNEIEWIGFNSWGNNPESGATQGARFEFGRGINDFWETEIEVNSEKEDGNDLRPVEFEWENKFQLTPQNKYWLNAGLYAEAEYKRGGTYEVKFGPMFGKRFGRFETLLNLFASHEYGNDPDPGVEFEYRFRFEYRWKPEFSPLIEAYGEPVGHSGDWGEPRNSLGPGFKGEIHFAGRQALEYGMVVLFGASGAAADTTLVARLEYSFF